MVGNTKPYYADSFTSDLRWAVFGIVVFLGCGLLSLLAVKLWVWVIDRRPAKPPRWVDWGAPDEIELPQDHAVRIIEPFDQDLPFVFDWQEWEQRLMADD